MRRQEINDFLVETNGHCFICARKVLHERNSNDLASSRCYTSLHRLSQYLKMDVSSVFHEKESIPSELLDSVKRSRLKVPLCEQCTKWNEKVSGLCLQLEKIETEVSFYLELFHGSLLSLEKGDGSHFPYKLDDDDDANSNGKLLEKERIVKALRTEARQKCSQRLKSVQPTVKVQNLTPNPNQQKRINSKSIKYIKPDITAGSSNWLENINQIKNEGSDIDGNEYIDDKLEFAEDLIDEDESNDDPLHIPTSHHQSHLYLQTEPASETVNNIQIQRASVSGLNSSSSLSTTIVTSASPEHTIEKLTYVINPETGKYQCNICQVEFTARWSLKRHYDSTHLKTKHKCTLCGKEFANKTTCTSHHKTVHVGVRFKCNLCGSCFTQKYSLIAHHKSVHLGTRFDCMFCEKSFSFKHRLNHHVRMAHYQ